jgi:hypothetical protein
VKRETIYLACGNWNSALSRISDKSDKSSCVCLINGVLSLLSLIYGSRKRRGSGEARRCSEANPAQDS